MTVTTMTRDFVSSRTGNVVLTIAGSLLIAASARIATPMYPVPMTLQTLAVVALAGMFGARLSTAMAVTYLLEGLAGLPVFAHGMAGPLAFVGPTAGYLIAFPVATWLVGTLRDRGFARNVAGMSALMLLAHAVIIGFGTAWLASRIGLEKAVVTGAAPFVVGSVVKSIAAAVITRLAPKY